MIISIFSLPAYLSYISYNNSIDNKDLNWFFLKYFVKQTMDKDFIFLKYILHGFSSINHSGTSKSKFENKLKISFVVTT